MNAIKNLSEAKEKLSSTMQELEKILENSNANFLSNEKNVNEQKSQIKTILKDLLFVEDNLKLAIDFTYFGQKCGGKAKSAEKTKAVRENGKKGGRPSKKNILELKEIEKDKIYKIFFNDNSSHLIEGNLEEIKIHYPESRYKWTENALKNYSDLIKSAE